MRVSLQHDSRRILVHVRPMQTVRDLKMAAIDLFAILPFLLSETGDGLDLTKLKLTHAGAELQDHWVLHDIGIENGSSLKITLIDIKPTLIINSKFNHKKIYIEENLDVFHCEVVDLRTIVTNKTGLPIGVFRLVSKEGEEMFDCQSLRKYNVTLGQTVHLEVWDGWNDFLKVSIMGYASQVIPSLSANENEAKYQLKVALHIAAFFGHVDLAVTLLKIGVCADEPVGYHPQRMWCSLAATTASTTPIHTAVVRGNLNVIRSMVHHDITCVLATDGNNLSPLQVALRNKQKACALFLITQVWTEITYDHKTSIPLLIYAKLKSWSNRARYRASPPVNPTKGYHRAPRNMKPIQPLVENGILVDGFSECRMNSRTVSQMKQDGSYAPSDSNHSKWRHHNNDLDNNDDPENYFKLITSMPHIKLPVLGSSPVSSRKHRKSAHFLEIPASNPMVEDVQYSDVPYPGCLGSRRNTEGLLRLPSIQLNATDGQHNFNRQLSRSVGDVHNVAENVTDDSRKYSRMYSSAAPRKSMPHLKLFNTIEDEFQFVKKVSRSQSLFENFLKKRHSINPEVFPGSHEQAQTMEDEHEDSSDHRSASLAKMSDREFAQKIFRHYQSQMGVSSRQFASKCLAVAESFTEKPWLQRLKQARTIATIGIRRTFDGKDHLFTHKESVNT